MGTENTLGGMSVVLYGCSPLDTTPQPWPRPDPSPVNPLVPPWPKGEKLYVIAREVDCNPGVVSRVVRGEIQLNAGGPIQNARRTA